MSFANVVCCQKVFEDLSVIKQKTKDHMTIPTKRSNTQLLGLLTYSSPFACITGRWMPLTAFRGEVRLYLAWE